MVKNFLFKIFFNLLTPALLSIICIESVYAGIGHSKTKGLPSYSVMRRQVHVIETNQHLVNAVEKGDLDAVRIAILKGADVNATDSYGNTPLHAAALNDRIKTIQLLIENGSDVNATNSDNCTPLHWAASYNYTMTVQLLIKNGAHIHVINSNGYTPLHCAALNGHTQTVQLLIKNGAQINTANQFGFTPLHCAAYNGHIGAVRCLIENGAQVDTIGLSSDVNSFNYRNVVCYGNKEIVRYLKQFIVFKQNIAIFNWLIKENNEADATTALLAVPADEQLGCSDNKWFNQLLRWSITVNNLQACKLLVRKGANPLAQINGYNALVLANDLKELAQLKMDQQIIQNQNENLEEISNFADALSQFKEELEKRSTVTNLVRSYAIGRCDSIIDAVSCHLPGIPQVHILWCLLIQPIGCGQKLLDYCDSATIARVVAGMRFDLAGGNKK